MVEIQLEQCNDSAVLMNIAASILWLYMVGGGRPTLYKATFSFCKTA